MKIVIASIAASLFTACTAFAATETHSLDYCYSLAVNGDNAPLLSFPGFDDQAGTRTLTGVGIRVQATVSASIAIENMTNANLGGWTVEADHTILAGFERQEPEGFGPFAFLGGLAMEPISNVLSANDGTPGSGRDFLVTSDSAAIDSNLEIDPSEIAFFLGGGQVLARVGPFSEFQLEGATQWNEFDGGDAVVGFTELAQAGTFSLIYTYTSVPEPTAMLAVAGAGVIFRRRRAK